MRQLLTIATNAFMELVRQPVFLLLMTFASAFNMLLASMFYFGFGDDQQLVKDSVLAVMLLTGLFGAVLSASASVANEIRTGTALAVLSKPVGRLRFLLGKYLGLAAALTLMTFVNFVCALLASRMAFDAYGDPDRLALQVFFGLVLLAYLGAGISNYFLRRTFVPDAVFGLVSAITLAFILISFFNKDGQAQEFAKGVDWRLVPASVLILFALLIIAGLALACSTRLEVIPTLSICTAFFLLGLMSDYLFGRWAQQGSAWGQFFYAIMPNWQQLWLADALENGKTIPWSYVGKALGYTICYLGAALAVALMLFEDRELT